MSSYWNYLILIHSISSLFSSSGTASLTATDNPDAATATEAISSLGFPASDVDSSSEEEDEDDEDEDEEELLLSGLGDSSVTSGAWLIMSSRGATWGSASLFRSDSGTFSSAGTISGLGAISGSRKTSGSGFGGSEVGSFGGGCGAGCFLITGCGFFGTGGGAAASGAEIRKR